MAIAFKNTSTTVALADTMQTMYTAPGNVNGSIVHAIYIANKLMTSAIVCSLVLVDSSASTEKYIMKDITVFKNTSYLSKIRGGKNCRNMTVLLNILRT